MSVSNGSFLFIAPCSMNFWHHRITCWSIAKFQDLSAVWICYISYTSDKQIGAINRVGLSSWGLESLMTVSLLCGGERGAKDKLQKTVVASNLACVHACENIGVCLLEWMHVCLCRLACVFREAQCLMPQSGVRLSLQKCHLPACGLRATVCRAFVVMNLY